MHAPRSPEDQEDVILFRGKLDLQPHEQRKMWLLRKQGSSDRADQPFPAPSEFEVQKADNFRKFYAAVISPAHLRVTAGGRIVPNTRGLPHPTFMWNAEKQFFESTDRTFNSELERQGSWPQGASLNATDLHSPLDIVKPAVENFFGPPLHAYSANMRAPSDTKSTQRMVAAIPTTVEKVVSENNSLTDESDITAIHGQVKISPPSQFDLSRPFFMNGQPFYPATPNLYGPANFSVLPFNMLGNPNSSYQSFVTPHGIPPPATLQLPAGSFYLPTQMTLDGRYVGQQGPSVHMPGLTSSMTAQHLRAPVAQPFSTVTMFPPTLLHEEPAAMLPQAVMPGHQIQALQQQLKHCENQLQNNKHQIDEQHVRYQQSQVQNQIRTLQSRLNPQGFQPTLLSQEHYEPSMWNLGVGSMGAALAPFTVSGGTEKGEATGDQISSIGGSNEKIAPVRPVLPSHKRLSAAAAMAPEFQPRSQLTIANEPGEVKASLAVTAACEDSNDLKNNGSQGKVEARLLSTVTNWSKPGQWANSTLVHGSAAIPNTYTTHHLTKGSASNHLPASLKPPASGHEVPPTNGVDPYLTGYPPPGLPVNSVKSSDMGYSRELMEEELRASLIYCGKAPRDLSKRLPKFEGKDFYPPSPEKASVNPSVQFSHTKSRSSQRSDIFRPTQEPSPPKFARNKITSTSQRESEDPKDPFQSANGLEQPTYEAAADNGSSTPEDDTASEDSWGITKAEEEELFLRPAYQTFIFNERQPSFDDTASVKLKPVDTRSDFTSSTLRNLLIDIQQTKKPRARPINLLAEYAQK
jgi:hypothetical protein